MSHRRHPRIRRTTIVCWAGTALAFKGGLPQCQQERDTCNANLTTCSTQLSECQAAAQQFPATGQTSCWNSSGSVVPCAGTGHDGEKQAGATLSYTDNADGTITDNNTGLVWEKKTNCTGGIHCVNDTYSWNDAFTYVADLNTANFAGHSDWRLPNAKELQSILNYESVPGLPSAFNDCGNGSCTAFEKYWSSTTYAFDPTFAFYVNFFSSIVYPDAKGATWFVRAVRGGSNLGPQ